MTSFRIWIGDTSMDIDNIHDPVLLQDCVSLVVPALRKPGSIVVDCTLGLAGHASAFLQAAPEARLIGIDRDAQALGLACERMDRLGLSDRFTPVHAAFDELTEALLRLGVEHVEAVFMDLGLSSLQIDRNDRGFSYSHDAPLDMRMDQTQELTAQRVLAEYSEDNLTRIFRDYGEEKYARPIAHEIVGQRGAHPLHSSLQLDELVDRVIPRFHRSKGNPAKRVFQALRIEVNGELDKLARTLPQAAIRLSVGGRIVVESYHSLEDKTVKSFMVQGLHDDVPEGLPVVPEDAKPFFKELTRGAKKANEVEIEHNPRSASVRLRGVELIRPLPERWKTRYGERARHDDETSIKRGSGKNIGANKGRR